MSVSRLKKKHFTSFNQDLDKLEDSSIASYIASNPPDILVENMNKIEKVYFIENPNSKPPSIKELLQYGLNKGIIRNPSSMGNGMTYTFGFGCRWDDGDNLSLGTPGLTAGIPTIKEKTESERKNEFLIKFLNKINEDKIEEVIKENTIYISEDINIDSEDEEQASYIKSIYKKSFSNYQLVEEYSKKIRDENFLNTVKELQLITQNILLKFNEKPFSVPKHSMFVDYYQERFVRFLKDYINMTTNTLSKEETMINEIKSIIINLKEVFTAEYNSVTKPDMLDLAIEIDLMKKNINEYTQNIKEKTTNVPLKNNIEVQKEQRNNVSQLKNELTVQKNLPEETKWYKNYGFYRAITIAGGLLFVYYFISKM